MEKIFKLIINPLSKDPEKILISEDYKIECDGNMLSATQIAFLGGVKHFTTKSKLPFYHPTFIECDSTKIIISHVPFIIREYSGEIMSSEEAKRRNKMEAPNDE